MAPRMCFPSVVIPWQALVFLAALLSALFGVSSVVYPVLRWNRYKRAKRWRDLLAGGSTAYYEPADFDELNKEWNARKLGDRTHAKMHEQYLEACNSVAKIEFRMILVPAVLTAIGACFAISAAVLVALLG
jgi:hypothetical protein